MADVSISYIGMETILGVKRKESRSWKCFNLLYRYGNQFVETPIWVPPQFQSLM